MGCNRQLLLCIPINRNFEMLAFWDTECSEGTKLSEFARQKIGDQAHVYGLVET